MSAPKVAAIDWTKPIRCKDGRAARVLATDLKGQPRFQVVVAIERLSSPGEPTEEIISHHDLQGRHYSIAGLAVENIPQRIQAEFWVNIYSNKGYFPGMIYSSKDQADLRVLCGGRIACVKMVVDCAEGEGL